MLGLVDADQLDHIGVPARDRCSGARVAPEREDEDRAVAADRRARMRGAEDHLRVTGRRLLRCRRHDAERGSGDPDGERDES